MRWQDSSGTRGIRNPAAAHARRVGADSYAERERHVECPRKCDMLWLAPWCRGIRNRAFGAAARAIRGFRNRSSANCAKSAIGFLRPCSIGELGTDRVHTQLLVSRGIRNPKVICVHALCSGYQEPAYSGYWEPLESVHQEPVASGLWEPCFGVTGTKRRGFRNRAPRKAVPFRSLSSLSTHLNCLTFISNRLSSNAAQAKKPCQDAASWGLRPRRLASPLRGYAPGANAPSHPASPDRRRAPPDKFSLGTRLDQLRAVTTDEAAAIAARAFRGKPRVFSPGSQEPGVGCISAEARVFAR